MKQYFEHFIKYGWVTLDLLNKQPVWEARKSLEEELCRILGKKASLEEYHHIAEQDEFHISLQTQLAGFFHENKFARKIIEGQIAFFEKLVGGDLLVQKKPYLRMTRPFKKQDNIGYHRDTFYGGSPYEISVLVPYVDLPAESSLSVMDASHTLSELLFPTTQIQNPDSQIVKGSQKHQLGFLYAPKLMGPSIEEKMRPIPLKVGQALIFSLSTVHGSVENRGSHTRWSTDIRVLNALAPVDLSSRPEYYENLASSPVTACAKHYFSENSSASL